MADAPLEIERWVKPTVGSNPTPSATFLCRSGRLSETYAFGLSLLVVVYRLPKLH